MASSSGHIERFVKDQAIASTFPMVEEAPRELCRLMRDGDSLIDQSRTATGLESCRLSLDPALVLLVDAGFSMQEAALLDRTTARRTKSRTGMTVAASTSVVRRGQVRDVLRVGMLRSDLRHAGVRGFAGLGQSIVSRVEILSLLGGKQRPSATSSRKGVMFGGLNRP